jgi:Leucine-rich repeat (LRR) protein
LAELPSAVAHLPALTFLDLCNNELKQMAVLVLPRLNELNLNYNQLKKLPDFGQQCGALRVLTMAHNQMEELPSLKHLRLLQELHINNNQLTLLHESVSVL